MSLIMTPERWQLIRELLASALELGSAERMEYVQRVSAGDPSLRAELERLLAADKDVGSTFLQNPAPFQLQDDLLMEPRTVVGLRLGAYQIVEEIGRGGMGEVYRAYRADDQYRKEVAIKLVRAGRNSESVVRRFRNERQILASLEHPYIARLLDGGTTEDGSPYFVMELIEGLPIDEYCDNHQLSISERLMLFRQVCTAVQFAHQHLIVHRDIKPSNMLVTPEGTPKLLDFGIAKLLDPTAADNQSEPTQTILRALTPGYASPEQVMGGTITTVSDVYSLGVVLYELLAGRSPYRLTGRTPQEIARVVCDVEPEKPSAAVGRMQNEQNGGELQAVSPTEAAVARQSCPDRLKKILEDDLDNIVLMALRKEPQRRYGSVEQFARDIRRHLENLPVLARKDTFRYRTSKFLTRHKAGVAGAAAFVLMLLFALTVTLWEAHLARQQADIAVTQRARAERHFNDLRELSNSLMLDVHDAIKDLPGSTPARKILIDKSLKYLDRLAREPSDDASLKRELAAGYERVAAVQGYPFGPNLGDTQGATESFRKAAAIWDSLSRVNPSDVNNLLGLAGNYRQLGGMLANGGGGDPLGEMKQAVQVAERLRGKASSDPRIAEELEHDYEMTAQIQTRTGGDPEGALEDLGKALAVAEQRLKDSPQDQKMRYRRFRIRVLMGDALADLGKRKEGLEQFRLGLETFGSDLDDARMQRVKALTFSKRGDILMMNGDFAAALQDYRQEQTLLGPLAAADPKNTQARIELAAAYTHEGHAQAELRNGSSALAILQRGAGILEPEARDPLHTEARCNLARARIWRGDLLARTRHLSAALENYRNSAADYVVALSILPWDRYTSSSLAASHARAGAVLAKLGRLSEAAVDYHRALEIAKPQALAKPSNALPWYVVSDAYSGLGELSKLAAQHSAANPNEQRQHLSEARDWYKQAVEAWQHISNPGVISSAGFTVGNPEQAALSLALCEAQLARLETSLRRQSSSLAP